MRNIVVWLTIGIAACGTPEEGGEDLGEDVGETGSADDVRDLGEDVSETPPVDISNCNSVAWFRVLGSYPGVPYYLAHCASFGGDATACAQLYLAPPEGACDGYCFTRAEDARETYDADGRLMRVDYDDAWIAYEYDVDGRLVGTAGGVDWDAETRFTTLGYDAEGRLDSMEEMRGENVLSLDTTTIEYDAAGNLVSSHLVKEFRFGGEPNYERTCESEYGANGRPESVVCTDNHGSLTESFRYDAQDRPSEFDDWKGTRRLEYAEDGRLIRGPLLEGETGFSYECE